jgi:hypothetical protein
LQHTIGSQFLPNRAAQQVDGLASVTEHILEAHLIVMLAHIAPPPPAILHPGSTGSSP